MYVQLCGGLWILIVQAAFVLAGLVWPDGPLVLRGLCAVGGIFLNKHVHYNKSLACCRSLRLREFVAAGILDLLSTNVLKVFTLLRAYGFLKLFYSLF